MSTKKINLFSKLSSGGKDVLGLGTGAMRHKGEACTTLRRAGLPPSSCRGARRGEDGRVIRMSDDEGSFLTESELWLIDCIGVFVGAWKSLMFIDFGPCMLPICSALTDAILIWMLPMVEPCSEYMKSDSSPSPPLSPRTELPCPRVSIRSKQRRKLATGRSRRARRREAGVASGRR